MSGGATLRGEREGDAPRTLVRAPNHLGDVVAALPALVADGSDVIVVRWLAPLLGMAGLRGEVLSLDRGWRGFMRATRELRARSYDRGVLLTPAFSAAWLFRWGGIRHLRGTDTDGRGVMLSERVPVAALRPHHRIRAYDLLLGRDPSAPPVAHRIRAPSEAVDRWRGVVGSGSPLVGLFPGANAPARRWPVDRFASLAAELGRRGARLVIMGGSGEVTVTSRVAASTPAAIDVGGHTDLVDLAALLSLCDLVVTNDTGPMHLAGAVGTPTVSLWGPSDPREVRQLGAPDARVTGPDLPCKPCYRNDCRRRGAGTFLADAHEECMRLIEVRDVLDAVVAHLEGDGRA